MYEFFDRVILSLFHAGQSSKEIADALDRSVWTINSRLAACLEMAGVATRPQMAVWLNAHPEVLKRNGMPVVAGQTVRQFVGPKRDWKDLVA